MVSFITLDLSLLVVFILAVTLFLYSRRKNLTREGLLYLYKTKWGINFIEKVSKKYSNILKPLEVVVITSGFILMTTMIYLLIKTLFLYFQQSSDSAIAKVPAIFPLIPYFPQIFKLDAFFPPFYFTYFILAIAIVAIVHEFSHGIFARLNNIKIHSTGFAFLGPFLGAFVEQDEKQMNKAKKIPQMAILAAGTFANVLTTIVFLIVMAFFFTLAYTPSGFVFNSYAATSINASDIVGINNISLNSMNLLKITLQDNTSVYATPAILASQIKNNYSTLLVFDNAPAINSGLVGAISQLDNKTISYRSDLTAALANKSPGDSVIIKTRYNNSVNEYNITLANRDGKAFLGIGSTAAPTTGFKKVLYLLSTSYKDPNTIYISKIGPSADFIYDLLWWITLINILVALFNMFPAGILDGGRFLMLAVWGVTGRKSWGEKALKAMTWLLLLIIGLMMIKWAFNLF